MYLNASYSTALKFIGPGGKDSPFRLCMRTWNGYVRKTKKSCFSLCSTGTRMCIQIVATSLYMYAPTMDQQKRICS